MFTIGLPPSISQIDVCICDQNSPLFSADGSEGSDLQPAALLITGIPTSHYSLRGTANTTPMCR